MPRSVKIAPEIDAKLYEGLVSVGKENGPSQRFVLKRAREHYLHNVVPSQRMVRPEVMAAYRRSNDTSGWLSDGRACLSDRVRSDRDPSSSD